MARQVLAPAGTAAAANEAQAEAEQPPGARTDAEGGVVRPSTESGLAGSDDRAVVARYC